LLEQKLNVPAGQVVEVGGTPAEGTAAGRRALKVLSPAVKLPPLKAIVVVKKGDFGPDVPTNYKPVTQITSYDQELRLPSADDSRALDSAGRTLRSNAHRVRGEGAENR